MLIISTSAEETSIQVVSPLLTMVAICSTVGALISVVAAAAADAGASGDGAALATVAAALAVASCAKAAVAAKSDVPSAPAPQINLRIMVDSPLSAFAVRFWLITALCPQTHRCGCARRIRDRERRSCRHRWL